MMYLFCDQMAMLGSMRQEWPFGCVTHTHALIERLMLASPTAAFPVNYSTSFAVGSKKIREGRARTYLVEGIKRLTVDLVSGVKGDGTDIASACEPGKR
jgi:hypothetical protein